MWETICDYIIMPTIMSVLTIIFYNLGYKSGRKDERYIQDKLRRAENDTR